MSGGRHRGRTCQLGAAEAILNQVTQMEASEGDRDAIVGGVRHEEGRGECHALKEMGAVPAEYG